MVERSFTQTAIEESDRLCTLLRKTELIRVFDDTLDEPTSKAAMRVVYHGDAGVIRTEIGIPYTIVENQLIMGPYAKEPRYAPPRDFESSKRRIPIANIVTFDRIDLSLDLLSLARSQVD